MDDPLSHSPEKEQGELLIIVGNPEVGEPCMFLKGVYFSVFYWFFMKWIYMQVCRRNRCWKREIRT